MSIVSLDEFFWELKITHLKEMFFQIKFSSKKLLNFLKCFFFTSKFQNFIKVHLEMYSGR